MPSEVAYDEGACQGYARYFLSLMEADELDGRAAAHTLLRLEKCSAHPEFKKINALRVEVEDEFEKLGVGIKSRKPTPTAEDVRLAECIVRSYKHLVTRDTWEALTWRSRFYYLLNENPGDAYRRVAGCLIVAGTTTTCTLAMGFTGRHALAFSLYGAGFTYWVSGGRRAGAGGDP
jgi:hypothetical protein